MNTEQIESLFAGADGEYRFARWGRPIVPVVFGVEQETLAVFKGAIEAIVALAGHKMAETDPELGANLMIFFMREWSELAEVPDMDALIPELTTVLGRLQAAGATQYRLFRFDEAGAIRAVFIFLRVDEAMANMAVDELALGQAARAMLLWGDHAFDKTGPLSRTSDGEAILRSDIAALIRASYDPVMPAQASDSSHAMRLAARVGGAG